MQRLKVATSNVACSWGLPRPIINPTQKKSGHGPGVGSFQKFGVLFNISATAEASHFNFGVHHKMTPVALGYGSSPKILGSLLIFCNSRSVRLQIWYRARLCQTNYKIIPKDKREHGPCLESSQNMGFPLIFIQWLKLAISNVVHSLGLP